MNEHLAIFARQTIKEGLQVCSDVQLGLFKRMYSPNDLNLHIDTVVDNIPVEKLSWAMTQVQNSISKDADQNENQR